MSFHIHIHSGKVAIDVSLIRSVVKFVRFFFILKVFIVPAAGIDYDRGLCLGRINSNYWNARRKVMLVILVTMFSTDLSESYPSIG